MIKERFLVAEALERTERAREMGVYGDLNGRCFDHAFLNLALFSCFALGTLLVLRLCHLSFPFEPENLF